MKTSYSKNSFSAFLTGVAALATVGVLIYWSIFGLIYFSIFVMKWAPIISAAGIVGAAVLLPLALIPAIRAFSAAGLYLTSMVFGTVLWVFGVAITYTIWGGFALAVGLVFAIVGVVPMAMIASLLSGEFSVLGTLIFQAVLTYGTRMLAIWLMNKAEERSSRMRLEKLGS